MKKKFSLAETASIVFPAPMAGVSDKPFRLILQEFGCPVKFTEMISAKGIIYGNPATLRLLDLRGEQGVVVQLFGQDPGTMARAAVLAVERGAVAVDVNVGCPMPKIVKNGEGAALMREPDRVGAIVRALVRAVPVPVTVKMRAGWDAAHLNAPEVALQAAAAGVRAVTVHGRTRDQFYTGRADWGVVRQVKEKLQGTRVAVIGNGDVRDGMGAARLLAETGCDAVMIGRAAQGNPWVFPQVRAYLAGREPPFPSALERLAVARHHLETALEYEAEPVAIRQMRKVLGWYVRGLPGAAELRRRLNTLKCAVEVQSALAAYSAQLADSG